MAHQWSGDVHGVRITLPALFYAVIGLSLVLTLLVLNEASRAHQLWLTTFGGARTPPFEAGLPSARAPDPASQRHVATAVVRRRMVAAAAERYRARLRRLRLPSAGGGGGGGGHRGWKLLPGNIVVPDGEAANPHDYDYILNPSDFCAGMTPQGGVGDRVLIFVESNAKNAGRRQAIRETWALPVLQRALNVRVVFLLGVSQKGSEDLARGEFYSYGDVVQENFTEGFRYLGLKSVMGLKWAATFCPQADFVVKTDDDILIHVPNLLQALSQYRNASGLLLCHRNKSRQIVRRQPSLLKYQVSAWELPGAFFPSYCGGFAYAMSRDAVAALFEASLRTPYFFIEDVYVTGFCRHRAGLEARDHPGIVLKPHMTAEQAPCSFAEGRVTSQELDEWQMRAFWAAANTRGFFCPVPVERRG